jgi:hypothetical protein
VNWSPDEKRVIEMRDLWRDGAGIGDLMAKFGMSHGAVVDACTVRTWRHLPGAVTRPRHPRAVPDDDVGPARRLHRSGLSLPQIAAQFGVSRTTASNAVHGIGEYAHTTTDEPPVARAAARPPRSADVVAIAQAALDDGKPKGDATRQAGVSRATLDRWIATGRVTLPAGYASKTPKRPRRVRRRPLGRAISRAAAGEYLVWVACDHPGCVSHVHLADPDAP